MSKIFVVGSINMDLVISSDVMPDSGVTVSGRGFMTNPGGKGANQAVAAAKSSGDVTMVGRVGSEFGDKLLTALKGYGVDVGGVGVESEVSSGIAVIIVVDGDNRIILDAGANDRLSREHIDAALSNAEKGDFLITQLEVPLAAVSYALKQAKNKEMITVLNPAPAKTLSAEILKYVDYFVPNQSETEFYTGIYPDSIKKAESAAKTLQNGGVENVVITLGSLGAVAVTRSESVQVEAFKVEAADTTAAGDTFVGAMVAMLAEGRELKYALTYANKAASVTVTRKGAQQSIPYRREITW